MENDCALNIAGINGPFPCGCIKFEAICNNHVLSLRSLVAVMHIEEMCALGNIVLQTAYRASRLAYEPFEILRITCVH